MRSKTITCAGILCALLATQGSARAQSLRGPTEPRHQLKMQLDETTLRVSGGNAFDPCAILLGLEARKTTLPGGAILRLHPLAMLVHGEFDTQGTFSIDIKKQLDLLKEPLIVLAQAITLVRDSEFFATSNALAIGMITSGGGADPVDVEPDASPIPVEDDPKTVGTEPDVPTVQVEGGAET